MALPGAKPKADRSTVRHRVPVAEWREYPNVPFPGAPELGKRTSGAPWPSNTRRWWRAVSRMPHCVDWTVTDWEFARDTAELHAKFHEGALSYAPELRRREQWMSTTWHARRDNRIRYVDPAEVKPTEADPNVTAMADYRNMAE
jgi:hypothetical protein